MGVPVFLAMTRGELEAASVLPERLGWMACHFSPYGTGLSNLPKTLPEGSMLILNDRTPVCGHDPRRISDTLRKLWEAFRCDSVLLDFQRPGSPEARAVAEAAVGELPCPVGVSEPYAQELSCPVLVPPVPAHQTAQEYLRPWEGREIWLELSLEGTEIRVDREGSHYTPLPCHTPAEQAHRDEALCCHYEIQSREDSICFSLGRTYEDLAALLQKAQPHGVTKAVGLWQEMGIQSTVDS